GGGRAEITDRIMRTNHTNDDNQASITNILMQICFVKVSTNSYEAKRYRYLKETDTVILNTERRIEIALNRARYESEANYVPLPKTQYIALGRDFKALAEGQLDEQRVGHFISDYDYEITLKIAEVLSGGDVPRNT